MKKTLLFFLSLCMILTFANLRVNTASALENNIIADMESDVSAETSIIGDYAEIPPTQFGTIENGEIIWKESGSAGEAELMSTTSFICDTYSLLVSETASLLTDTIPSGTTVTWSSQNTDIATVSSSGVVTGVKAGTARINASVNDGTSTVVKQVSVYVIIENGVYYIKNNATSKYLHVNNSSIAENAGLVVSTKLTSDPARLAQLWRINYLGEGCYSIRPMHKLDMCLQRYGLGVAIGARGTTENVSDLSGLAQWRISGVSSGYKLDSRSYTSQYLYVNGTAVSLGGTSNNVWSLVKLSSVPSGVLLYNTQSWIAPESTVQFVAAVYSGSTLNQGVTWTSSNTDVAKVNSSGVVTGVAAGTSVITAKSTYNTSWSKTFTVNIGDIPNGTYFFRNKETLRMLDIEGPTTNANAVIHQWQFSGHDSQQWEIELQQDGYYTIKSVYSSLYLSVAGNSSSQNATITQLSGGTATGQRWKFTKLSNGAYKISAKCGESSNKCLAVADYTTNENGILIQHKTFTNDSNYRDEWYVSEFGTWLALNLYYDKAFEVRYGNPTTLINNFGEKINDIFGQNFSMEIYFNSPALHISTPDNCKLSRNISINSNNINNDNLSICPANPSINGTCPNHQEGDEDCTSWLQIYRDFIALNPGSNTTTSVLFTGNRLYNSNGNTCNRSYIWYNNGIVFQEIWSNSTSYYNNMLPCLTHEIAHTIGAPDHYHELKTDGTCRSGDICSECGNNKRPAYCIMNNVWGADLENVDPENIFCQECKVDIISHLNEHHK